MLGSPMLLNDYVHEVGQSDQGLDVEKLVEFKRSKLL